MIQSPAGSIPGFQTGIIATATLELNSSHQTLLRIPCGSTPTTATMKTAKAHQ